VSYKEEFAVIDAILASTAETRGVDAFALALIKCERQARRLLTHSVFQYPCFSCAEVSALREALSSNKDVYFDGLIRGFDAIHPRSIEALIGQSYGQLRGRLNEAIDHRNKIFHGQLTSKWLTRDDLIGFVNDIRSWSESLGDATLAELGYDGFARNSFHKSDKTKIWERYRIQLTSVADYERFIREHMQRRSRNRRG
jgi:hypothetical protein